jgi:hypothetical protein
MQRVLFPNLYSVYIIQDVAIKIDLTVEVCCSSIEVREGKMQSVMLPRN